MATIWDRLESKWPPVVGGRQVGFDLLREQAREFLVGRAVIPVAFSHFGVAVSSIDDSLDALAELTGVRVELALRNWVEAYKVHVARGRIEGVELEFIEPAGPSIFADALGSLGEGLQHLSFQVEDIEGCLEKLKSSGVELVDGTPRNGSHGKVAFTKPREFAPLYLELCQPAQATEGNFITKKRKMRKHEKGD